MRYFLSYIMLCLSFVSFSFAKTVEINSDNWIFDKQRFLVIDEFDYIYSLKSSLLRGRFLELTDGSIWKVEELGKESKSFYANCKEQVKIKFIEDLVKEWQEGERLIFHKVFNQESLLVYNLDRDLLVDVSPFLPPLDENCLVITRIDQASHEIALSDGSSWNFDHLCPCARWKEGNPILIAKDTPWWSNNTHILINLIPCECDASVAHIHPNRLGVR